MNYVLVGCMLVIQLGLSIEAAPQITIRNSCPYDIWIGQTANNGFPQLNGNGLGGGGRLSSNGQATYDIPGGGWGGRFWPKVACDDGGNNCQSGSSVAPCPSGGCQPPAETKIEFFYHPLSDTTNTPWYDISLVDGYSIPVKISPSAATGGSCVETSCGVSLDHCPTDENNGLGDLRATSNGRTVMCLSPCKKWNYPPPYGMGRNENEDPGIQMCCPFPDADRCRRGDVVRTKYVELVRRECPSAYSFAYDDEAGLHNCPAGTSFTANFCG